MRAGGCRVFIIVFIMKMVMMIRMLEGYGVCYYESDTMFYIICSKNFLCKIEDVYGILRNYDTVHVTYGSNSERNKEIKSLAFVRNLPSTYIMWNIIWGFCNILYCACMFELHTP
jgi:hypothetical protein